MTFISYDIHKTADRLFILCYLEYMYRIQSSHFQHLNQDFAKKIKIEVRKKMIS